VEQACDFIRQIAQGLQHAHQLGLVHRDIKPANLFLINPPVQGKQLVPGMPPPARRSGDPTVKILDWGLSRLRRQEGDPPESAAIDSVTMESVATEKGLLIGTADYISPEQTCDPTVVDTRSDIYSLGCTFFYLLTGESPFGNLPLMQKLLAHRQTPPPNIRELRPDVPPEVEHILAKMLSKSPQDRYQIPLLLVAPLRHFCAGTTALVGGLVRPPSAISLARPASGLNLARPASVLHLDRPASSLNLNRPPSSLNLNGSPNGNNGTGHGSNGNGK
jgi:serine/threonine-protein kinase